MFIEIFFGNKFWMRNFLLVNIRLLGMKCFNSLDFCIMDLLDIELGYRLFM